MNTCNSNENSNKFSFLYQCLDSFVAACAAISPFHQMWKHTNSRQLFAHFSLFFCICLFVSCFDNNNNQQTTTTTNNNIR
mmetsp:Transcript_5043/g.14745  ORF Transcript_5043/g.14745 Transcript_5043/m.14745 type:complete len:80 (+) Transcript_5043:21-260(+)